MAVRDSWKSEVPTQVSLLPSRNAIIFCYHNFSISSSQVHLIHSSYRIKLKGESIRKKKSSSRKKKETLSGAARKRITGRLVNVHESCTVIEVMKPETGFLGSHSAIEKE